MKFLLKYDKKLLKIIARDNLFLSLCYAVTSYVKNLIHETKPELNSKNVNEQDLKNGLKLLKMMTVQLRHSTLMG